MERDPWSSLASTCFGEPEWVSETGSTNRDLLDRAAGGSWDRAAVVRVADHQTAGRGRRERSWEDAPGHSLLCSVLLEPPVSASRLHLVTLAFGLSALDACTANGVDGLGLKWPNDLVTLRSPRDRKLAGILAESRVSGGSVEAVVIGMGLNVARPPEVSREVAERAAWLDDLVSSPPDRRALLVSLLVAFDRRLRLLAESPDQVVGEAARRSATLGRTVRVERPGARIVGEAVELRADGALVVLADGVRHTITAADVIHLRPHERRR